MAARLEREAAGSDVRTAIGALLPQISLQGTLSSQETFEDGFAGQEAASVGVFVTVPLFSGGFNYSNVREAQALVEGASANINNAMRTAARNTGNSWANLQVARASIKAGRVDNVEILANPIHRTLRRLRSEKPTAVILNPAGVGADSRALGAIITSTAKSVAYLSCNPTTLVRDLAELIGGGFHLISVQPIDMMPQTRQVEALAFLRR